MTQSGPQGQLGRVIVGVDGSASSKAALAWAARWSKLSAAPLVAVATWDFPASYAWVARPPEGDPAAETTGALRAALDEVLGEHPGIELSTEVICGHPAPVLTSLSKAAALLVVGSSGHGEFAGMLLGSVSRHVVAHAHCPVVVVRNGYSTSSHAAHKH